MNVDMIWNNLKPEDKERILSLVLNELKVIPSINEDKELNEIYNRTIKEMDAQLKVLALRSKKLIDNIITNSMIYFRKHNIKDVVIGISGGLDSAVCAALMKECNVRVHGRSIPMNSSEKHKEYANWVGDMFCDTYYELNELDELATKSINIITARNMNNLRVRMGNIKARLRMITLYDLANSLNGIVISTDNYSEYLMGFWTICGDVGDFAPIQKCWKGYEIPAMAHDLGVKKEIINQEPSDGLNVTDENTDEAQLGAPYKIVDCIMRAYVERHSDFYNDIKYLYKSKHPIVEKIIGRHLRSEFKRHHPVMPERLIEDFIWKCNNEE